jgi:hypothetical protein
MDRRFDLSLSRTPVSIHAIGDDASLQSPGIWGRRCGFRSRQKGDKNMISSEPENHASRERRSSYRCAVSGPRRVGRLKISEREVAVEILDESVNGFSVMLDGAPECDIGDILSVQVASNWSEVRVMNLQLQKSITEEEPGNTVFTTRTRLGLLRLRDIDAWDAAPERPRRRSWRQLIVPLMPVGRPLTTAVGLILGIFLGFMVLVWALESSAPLIQVVGDDVPHGSPRDDVPLSAPSTEDSRSRSVGSRPYRPLKVKLPIASTAADPPARSRPEQAMPEEAIRLSRPEFLLQPQISRLLALSREQVDKLRRIFDEYQTTAKEAVGADWNTSSTPAIDDAEIELGRHSLAVLTEAQRVSLMRHLSATDLLQESSPTNERPIQRDRE